MLNNINNLDVAYTKAGHSAEYLAEPCDQYSSSRAHVILFRDLLCCTGAKKQAPSFIRLGRSARGMLISCLLSFRFLVRGPS
ncbi:hypothetical protein SPHINGOT1_450002 [Sphingomonas sp. T1]|nr:hypothetical protein SPHINGOT1_450002 [Sphingomonas sp. T1]